MMVERGLKEYIEAVNSRPLSEFIKLTPSKGKGMYCCPMCGSGTRKNGTGALSIKNNRAICFSCGCFGDRGQDTLGAIMVVEGIDMLEALRRYGGYKGKPSSKPPKSSKEAKNVAQDSNATSGEKKSLYEQNIQSDEALNFDYYFVSAHNELLRNKAGLEYLAKRGICVDTIKRFFLGFDPNWQSPKALREGKNPPFSQRIIIPTGKSSYVARDINPDAKSFRVMKEGAAQIFNSQALYGNKPVFVVEGEFDALSVAEVGANSIALGSVSNVDRLIELCKDKLPTAPLILNLDNDKCGKEAQSRLKEGLLALEINVLEVEACGSFKDQNEFLVADREAFSAIINSEPLDVAKAEADAVKDEYLQENAAKQFLSFLEQREKNAEELPISTGFPCLDAVLEGGLSAGLIILGAISSLGKTAYVCQMADQIAQQGEDILMFSIEMPENEIMARSVSRLTFEIASGNKMEKAKTTKGILLGHRFKHYSNDTLSLIRTAEKRYLDYAENIRIFEEQTDRPISVEHIERAIKKHIAITGNKPVVVVDYIQIIEPIDSRLSDKQNTDRTVKMLKQISRDNGITIIGISSLNRQSYNASAAMEAFKESGSLEYSADVLIMLQLKGVGESGFDVNIAKNKEPRAIELKILKNRCGKTGGTIEYSYYPAYNFFVEQGETTSDIIARQERNNDLRRAKRQKRQENTSYSLNYEDDPLPEQWQKN